MNSHHEVPQPKAPSLLQKIREAFKSTLIYGLGNLSIKLVGLLLLPLYTTYLPVADYGVLALLESLSQVFVALFGVGITSALFRWYWDKNFEGLQRSMFFTVLVFAALMAVLMLVAVVPLARSISEWMFDTPAWGRVIQLMAVFSALEIIIAIPSTLIRLQERPKLYSATMFLRLTVNLVVTVLLILYVSATIDSIYIAQIVGGVVYLLVLIPFVIRNITVRFESALLKAMVAYSFPLVLGSISTIAVAFGDRYLLKLLGALADVGIYSLGLKIANVVLFVVMSIQLAVTPMIYRAIDEPGSGRFFSKLLSYLSFAVMWLILAVSILGHEVVVTLAQNPDYWPAANVIPIVTVSIFFMMARDIVTTGLIVRRKTTLLSSINAGMAVLNLLFDLLLIPWLGIMGAAWAAVLTQAVSFTTYLWTSQRAYHVPYEIRKFLLVLVVGVILIGGASLISEWPSVLRGGVKVGLLLSFPLCLYVLGFYEDMELVRLREAYHKWKHVGKWGTYLREL